LVGPVPDRFQAAVAVPVIWFQVANRTVISPHFRPGRHRLNANEYRREMTVRFAVWNEVTSTATAA
jgi:hypothetical protein